MTYMCDLCESLYMYCIYNRFVCCVCDVLLCARHVHVHVQCMRFLFGLSEVMFSDSILTDITPQDGSPDEPLLPMDNPAA